MYPEPGKRNEIVIPHSRTKLILLLIGALAFVAIGCWLWTADPRTGYNPVYMKCSAVLGIVFSGLCGIYICIRLFDRRPGFIIDDEGFIDNSSAVAAGRVPWSDILAIRTIEINLQPILVIYVADPQKYMERDGAFTRMLKRANLIMVGSPVTISTSGLNIHFNQLGQLLIEGVEKYHREIGS